MSPPLRNSDARTPGTGHKKPDEQGHAKVVRPAAEGGRVAATIGSDIARAEPWHRSASGNHLRAAVLGANDGLVSNFCLVMGVAGAGASAKSILLTKSRTLLLTDCDKEKNR